MSKIVRTAMERTRPDKGSDLPVLVALAAHANKELLAWPKQEIICRLSKLKVRTVQYALRRLEDRGEIRVVKHGQGRGSTTYSLAICVPEFDVIEPDENLHGYAGYIDYETCTTKQVSDFAKPTRRHQKPAPRCVFPLKR